MQKLPTDKDLDKARVFELYCKSIDGTITKEELKEMINDKNNKYYAELISKGL